ncbi:hypothetical protein ACEPAH_5317 [Sanghuangporus vaninii]
MLCLEKDRLTSCVRSNEKFEETRRCLKHLEGRQTALESFSYIVGEKVRTVEETVFQASRHRERISLPDEILIHMHVIDMVCAETEKHFGRKEIDDLIKNLSLVSRRFRYAVLNTLSLWTRIDNRYCLKDGLGYRIARTANKPLDLHIDLSSEIVSSQREAITRQIVPLKDRWQHLRASFAGRHLKASKAGRIFGMDREMCRLDIPHLESAHIHFSSMHSYYEVFNIWNFMPIKTLELVAAVPPAGQYHKLTTFRLKVNSYSYHRLMTFLSCAPNLGHLSLDLCAWSIIRSKDQVPVSLPRLSTLSLSNHDDFDGGNDYDMRPATTYLCLILASMRIPNVKDLRLCLRLDGEFYFYYLIETLTDRVRDAFHAVTGLCITLYFTIVDEDAIKRFFALFPNVQELGLDIPDVLETIRDLHSGLGLNQLRSLVLGENVQPYDCGEEKNVLCNLTRSVDDLNVEWKNPVCKDSAIHIHICDCA